MPAIEERRKALRSDYERLSPEERRQRFCEPGYRTVYDKLTGSERIAWQQAYFWEKWVPILGALPSMVYMKLRQYCFFDRKTGEERNECWPKQATLARELGIKDRKTVRKALRLLEEYGFITRKSTFYRDEQGRPHQGTDHYVVYNRAPLHPEDAVEALLLETQPNKEDGGAYEGTESSHRRWIVDKPSYGGKKSPCGGGENVPSRTSTRTNTPNVTNVEIKSCEGRANLSNLPQVPDTDERHRLRREGLALEIGDSLARMAGGRDTEGHRSAGFHRRVVFLMPETLVREALTATRDAVERERGGGKALGKGPGAYFAGVVKLIAEREGISLGVRWKGGG